MNEYRVTKYNPKYRDSKGRYTKNEWTSFSDIGDNVTESEYEKVEAVYIDSALKFLEEQDITGLRIESLENSQDNVEPDISLTDGAYLNFDELRTVLRGILRGKYWAKLEGDKSFIHIGWDYYMYIGVLKLPKQAIQYAESRGLFVETHESPYKNEL